MNVDDCWAEPARDAEVVALDQDRRGVQAWVLSNQDGHWVFAKHLANDDVAIALFNETTSSATIGTTAYTARDLWARQDLQTAGRISAVVPPRATAVYRVHAGGSWWRNAPLVSTGIEVAAAVPGVPGEITPAGKPFEVTRCPRPTKAACWSTPTVATGVRTWQDPALPLAADLHGAQYLRLVVTDGGDGNSYDRSDWAAAHLTCA